jgi:hypothetical protein
LRKKFALSLSRRSLLVVVRQALHERLVDKHYAIAAGYLALSETGSEQALLDQGQYPA